MQNNLTAAEIEALRAELLDLRARAAIAYDFYRNAECAELNRRAWVIQDRIEGRAA